MGLNNTFTKRLVFVQLILLFVLFLILNLLSDGSYGGADDIGHYRFAKYAIKYPALILDQWAKPLFTLLASPFAQFGYWGVRLFNVILGVITAILLFKIGNHLKIRRSWTLPTILFFVPVYTSMLLSGMTEILFALVLVYAIFLIFKEKYIGSAIVISFLHLARTEGIVLWPIFIAVYILKKQWKALPFLLTGSLIYTIVGGIYFNDFLCLFTKMPYTGTYDIYGHGELLHFVKATKLIFGIPLTIFFIIGLIHEIYCLLKRFNNGFLFSLFLIFSPIVVFYAAHSYVWWKGINSLGLIRVMACISPLFAIYSLKGINLLIDVYQSNKFISTLELSFKRMNVFSGHSKKTLNVIKTATLIFIGYLVISTPFKVMEIPVPLPEKEAYVKKAANWFINSDYKERKIYVWDPYFWFFGGIESYNTPKMADGIPNRQNPEIDVKPGEIVIWDAHFSAVDGRFPFENIASNPYYKLVHAIVPKREILVFGHPYFMTFFERLDSAVNYDNYKILDSIKVASSPIYSSEILILGKKDQKTEPIKSIEITSNAEFYDLIKTDAGSVGIQEGTILKINFRVKGKPVILVVSLKHNRDLYLYQPKEVQAHAEWSNYAVKVPLVVPKNNADIFSVYFWNKDASEAEVDSIHLEILRECN